MKSKTLASLVLAGGVAANVLAIDNTVLDSWVTNHIYCPARYVVEGFDKKGIVNVDVAVYMDKELAEEQKDKCLTASTETWAEYITEFGINLRMREAKDIDIPENKYTFYFEVLDSTDDITIIFTNKRSFPGGDDSAGFSDPTSNVIFVYANFYNREAINNVLIHEIGHLFYASHTDDNNCYMYGSMNYYNEGLHWCDDEKNDVRMFKHKFW